MSGLYGALDFSGDSLDENVIGAMGSVFAGWFCDEQGQWEEGNVGLGHTALWLSSEEIRATMPLCEGSAGGRLVITADVRLDNRVQLLGQFGLEAHRDKVSDGHLILESYRRWGDQCPAMLLGDFVFVLWDEQRAELFCARDQVGIKSLYYERNGSMFSFANHLRSLTAATNNPKISEAAVAAYLKEGELYTRDTTFFENVKKLPPACTMTVTHSTLTIREYWRLEKVDEKWAGSFEDSGVCFRQLLEKSVKTRLGGGHPVAAHLSGGLDSSAIVEIAARDLKQQGRQLETFNWCPGPVDTSAKVAPEWSVAIEFARELGIAHHHVNLTAESLAEIFKSHDVSFGDTVDLWYEFEVRRSVNVLGARTILSGWGGDQVASNHGDTVLLDLFFHGRPVQALKLAWAAASRTERHYRQFFKIVHRFIAQPAYRFLTHKSVSAGLEAGNAVLARPNTQRLIAETQSIEWDAPVSTVRAEQEALFSRGHMQNRLESWYASGLESGVQYAYPLLDRRILEFAVSLPPEYYWGDGMGRGLFRASLGSLGDAHIAANASITEVERVGELLKLEREALVSCKAYCVNAKNSTFIDNDRLENAINELSLCGKYDQNSSELANTLIRSLLLLRLG